MFRTPDRRHCPLSNQRRQHGRSVADADRPCQANPRPTGPWRSRRADPEEIAFYDALADNESAVDIMGNDSLKVIAAELVNNLRANANATIDWSHRESARARMRALVKRILRKYGYPPDLQDAAVQTVIQQAELLAGAW